MNDIINIHNVLKQHSSEHGILFKALFYSAIVLTVFLISFLHPPRFYQKFIAKLFDISFTWRGAVWKVYNVIVLKVVMLGFLFFGNSC